MVEIELPAKEYRFLKSVYDNMSNYLMRVEDHVDTVVLCIFDERFKEFRLDFRSTIVRKGTVDKEAYNDTGLRLISIYQKYVQPVEDELLENTQQLNLKAVQEEDS